MYIGKTPALGNYQKCDAITTSATATYNLTVGSVAVSPETANNCIVSLNGVIQAPTSAYTISGSQIVFNSALTSADVIDFILILGDVLDIGTVSDGTITAAKLADTAISGKTALAVEPADTDEFLVSDGGVLKRLDYSLIKAPAGGGWGFVEAVTASDDATISFSTAFVNGFDYQVTGTNIKPASESYWFRAQFGTGSSTFLTSNYRGAAVSISSGASVSGVEAGSEVPISAVQPGNAANEDGSFTMWIPQPYASVYTQCQGVTGLFNTSSATQSGTFFGLNHASTSVTHIKFYYSSGNVGEGIFKLYKRANA